MKEHIKVHCTLMRGGTSKAVFLNESQVPQDPEKRKRFLLALFGSPDKRQIDGLGGADALTSKCALIASPSRPDADIDYTFAQIGIEEATVSYEIVCGNISSAAGVYAIEEGLVPPQEPMTLVRIHNTNTGKILNIKVPVKDGVPRVEGDYAIDGVPGFGAEVALDYSDTSGGATGKLLPTGRVRDTIHISSIQRDIEVSIIDVGTLCVFFKAADVGLSGTEQPLQIRPEHFEIAEEVRQAAALLCELPPGNSITPFQIMVGPAAAYPTYAGDRTVNTQEVDLVARMIGRGGVVHKTFPGGGSVCTSVAAQIEGTVVHECSAPHENPSRIRIGHPSGVLSIYSDVVRVDGLWKVQEVLFSRTARRLMDGYAYVRNDRL